MKKIISLIIVSLFLFGCGCTNMSAKNAVTDYLSQYNNLTDEVIDDIDKTISSEDLTEEEKEKYKDIVKKQYQDLKYEIVDEKYNGDQAVITAKISVYDLYKAEKDAKEYMTNNTEEFYDSNNIYSNKKYIDYKLDQMKKMNDKITYTIEFNVSKKDGKWVVEQPSQTDLEKIHGIYNYEL